MLSQLKCVVSKMFDSALMFPWARPRHLGHARSEAEHERSNSNTLMEHNA